MQKVEITHKEPNMVQYDLIINQVFFKSVFEYIADIWEQTEDVKTKNKITIERLKISELQEKIENLMKLRAKGFNEVDLWKAAKEIKITDISFVAFAKPGSSDMSVACAFRDVIKGICEYTTTYIERPELIEVPLKKWKELTTVSKYTRLKNNLKALFNYSKTKIKR